jgi:hypothetical protein
MLESQNPNHTTELVEVDYWIPLVISRITKMFQKVDSFEKESLQNITNFYTKYTI